MAKTYLQEKSQYGYSLHKGGIMDDWDFDI